MFLEKHQLEELKDLFQREGATLNDVLSMEDDDIKDIGIEMLSLRRSLKRAIRAATTTCHVPQWQQESLERVKKFPNTWIWRRIERGESALTKRKHPTTDMDNGRAHQRMDVSLSDCGEREGAGTEDWTSHAACMDGCFTLCEPCKEKQVKSPEGALRFSSAAHGTKI